MPWRVLSGVWAPLELLAVLSCWVPAHNLGFLFFQFFSGCPDMHSGGDPDVLGL